MKKLLLWIFIALTAAAMTGCGGNQEESGEDKKPGFSIYSWNAGLGSQSDDSLDVSRYTYTLYLSSETEELSRVKQIEPMISNSVIARVISGDLPSFTVKEDYIEVNGELVFDTQGLTKQEILDLQPYIYSVKVTMKNNAVYTVQLNAMTTCRK